MVSVPINQSGLGVPGVAVCGEHAVVGALYDDDGEDPNVGSAYFFAGVNGGYLEQDWTLDQLGNWPDNTKNHVKQERTHTAGKANEIAEIDGDDTHIAHDAAGNMSKIPRMASDRTILGHRKCVYDAWNRLVKERKDVLCAFKG